MLDAAPLAGRDVRHITADVPAPASTDMSGALNEQVFWLTLANAFLPPKGEAAFAAFRDGLPLDLAELTGEMGLAADAEIASLRMGIARMSEALELLVEYSSLFLQPPVPAPLNLTRYVDGSVNGPCLDALENAYRLAGIAKRDDLRDLPDHIAVQLETLAVLLGEEQPGIDARAFANLCLVGALPRLAAAIAAEAPASPYAALARLAAKAIAGLAEPTDSASERRHRRAQRRADPTLGVWRSCDSCGRPFAREKEIAIMAKALAQVGLPAEHLARCPDCRDAAQGFFRRQIK